MTNPDRATRSEGRNQSATAPKPEAHVPARARAKEKLRGMTFAEGEVALAPPAEKKGRAGADAWDGGRGEGVPRARLDPASYAAWYNATFLASLYEAGPDGRPVPTWKATVSALKQDLAAGKVAKWATPEQCPGAWDPSFRGCDLSLAHGMWDILDRCLVAVSPD